jgi:hypothetical protein
VGRGRDRGAQTKGLAGVGHHGRRVTAVWITLDANFLAYPGGWRHRRPTSAFIDLYWRHQRPESRFGPMLIGFGFVGAVYVLQSYGNPWLCGFGVVWENVIYLATLTRFRRSRPGAWTEWLRS